MLYKVAEEIGIECGLTSPDEILYNIILHSSNFFEYSEIHKEIKELLQDAYDRGIDCSEQFKKLLRNY
jgi:hypothetical protein